MTHPNLPPATSVHLGHLIDLAEAAVVSKTLFSGDFDSVTLFAFAAGQGLSEHKAPFEALVQVIEGAVIPDHWGKGSARFRRWTPSKCC